MYKKIIKAVVLALVFLAALIGLSIITGSDQVNLTEEMPKATLPVVYLQKEDIVINELFGYRGEMDAESIRDTVTPLSEDMVLPVTIQTFQNHVEEISYEVRSMDMERLLEQTQVSGYRETAGEISTQFTIQNLLEKNQEYHLIITLECGGEEIRYYTRIMRSEDCYVEDSLNFVLDFHAKTFDPEASAELATYLEPNKEGDNTTLQKVTIHSSLKQVAWGDFEGEVLKDPVPSVKEINSSYNSIVLNYIVVSNGENGESEFYNVEEYFRVRFSTVSNRVHLLDYERTMNEVFRGSGDHISGPSLLLGIRDTDVSYMANESATIIGFVQEGDLWSYNSSTNQLSCVYSFRGMEGFNDRENNPDHDIRIINVNESGSMDFVVYGYMNRGTHEGYTAVALYHYDSIANTVQEELFVPSRYSYQVLKEKWGDLFYTSSKGCFYMAADGIFYRIHLEDGTAEPVRSGLEEDNFAVSKTGRYAAWQEEEAENIITVTDLETEKQWQITGASGEALRPVGFVDSDFVYGIMRPQETGDMLIKIIIVDENQQVIKEYEKSGYYISDAYVENATVFLERVRKNENGYTRVDDDAIKSHEIEAAQNIQIETVVTGPKQTQVKLTAKKEFSKKTPQILTPKEVVVETDNTITLKTAPETGYYYVHVGGKIILCTRDAAEAVQCADENAGVVLEDNLWYIWRRGKQTSASRKEEISEDMTARINAGEAPESAIKAIMPEAGVVDLTGCSLSQVLYFVSQGSIVFAGGAGGEILIVAGYDEWNVNLYHPATGSFSRQGLEDCQEMFAAAGNVFISYIGGK